MPKYTRHTTNTDSEFEDDDHMVSRPKRILGRGSYAIARELYSGDKLLQKVVLSPTEKVFDSNEIAAKSRFYEIVHHAKPYYVEFTRNDSSNTYRLVLPLLPGKTYNRLTITNKAEQHILLFLSAIEALEQCHQKGLIVADLHSSNILFDVTTGKSHLIDGGLSALKDEALNHHFKQANEQRIQHKRAKCRHVAPECFALTLAHANEAMDIYSLGYMMQKTLETDKPRPEIAVLYLACQYENPDRRPSLTCLRNQLLELQHVIHATSVVQAEKESSSRAEIKKFTLEHAREVLLMAARNSSSPILMAILNLIISFGSEVISIVFQPTDTNAENIKVVLQHAKANVVDILLGVAISSPEILQSLFDIILALKPEILETIVQQTGKDGWNILMIAIRYFPNAIVPLINIINTLRPDLKSAIFENKNHKGWNALMIAIKHHPEIVITLIGIISSLSSAAQMIILLQKNSQGTIPVRLAASFHPQSVEPLLDHMGRFSPDIQVKHFLNPIVTVLKRTIKKQSETFHSFLTYVHQLKQNNWDAVRKALQPIPLHQFTTAAQLIDYIYFLGDFDRKLTSSESEHFACLLTPKDWYQMAILGLLPSEIKKSKNALVYQHIMSMDHTKQQELLEVIESGTTCLGDLLKKGNNRWFSKDYLTLFKTHLHHHQALQTKVEKPLI